MLCDCGHDSTSFSVRLTSSGARTICRNCRQPRLRESVLNPYSGLVLDHASDEQGHSVRVDSLRQMQQAEKRYRFHSLVANVDAAHHDDPPQHRPRSVLEQMSDPYTDQEGNAHESHWLYPEVAEAMVRDLQERGELGQESLPTEESVEV